MICEKAVTNFQTLSNIIPCQALTVINKHIIQLTVNEIIHRATALTHFFCLRIKVPELTASILAACKTQYYTFDHKHTKD